MRVTRLFISPEHNFFGHHEKPAGTSPVIEVEEVECLAGQGLKGDRFCGWKPDYKGQVTFFSEEVWEQLCERLQVADKGPEVFRRNIVVRDANLTALIGQEFELQGVRFLGTQESAPCYWMDQAFAPGAERALHGKGGLRAKILSDGVLRRGA